MKVERRFWRVGSFRDRKLIPVRLHPTLSFFILFMAVLLAGCAPEAIESPTQESMATLEATHAPVTEDTPTPVPATLVATAPQAATATGIVSILSPTDTPVPPEIPQVFTPESVTFDGEMAYEHVAAQVNIGPRNMGTEGHAQAMAYIADQLEMAGWQVEIQQTEYQDHPIFNIIGTRQPPVEGDERPWLILGAHYDTRMYADQDPDPEMRVQPVPGANDGASGVAVLLELARVLPAGLSDNVWLVFFDAEDNGNIPGYEWIMGSRAFVAALDEHPDAAVIVDMIGDADLNIYYEYSSNPSLSKAIWDQAAQLGYSQFIPQQKYHIIDDHTPFLEAGIPAVDIIDFDYPYWHTVEDTLDKVSPESLEAVGRTLQAWLEGR
jgi:glutaminyl-peptide cyclotransferase